MQITARCHPALRPHLLEPVPASKALPDWLAAMPGEVDAESMGGASVRTLKHCPPLIDALRLGVMLRLSTDFVVNKGEICWDWDIPALADNALSRAPIGIHVPEQAQGSAFDGNGDLIIKFINHWLLEVPEGWSIAFHHPVGYPDLPFTTLSGVVDCDRYRLGHVHFPAVLRPDFEGTIPRGTPVAQCVPVQRSIDLSVEDLDDAEIVENYDLQERIGADPGVYRKEFRR